MKTKQTKLILINKSDLSNIQYLFPLGYVNTSKPNAIKYLESAYNSEVHTFREIEIVCCRVKCPEVYVEIIDILKNSIIEYSEIQGLSHSSEIFFNF